MDRKWVELRYEYIQYGSTPYVKPIIAEFPETMEGEDVLALLTRFLKDANRYNSYVRVLSLEVKSTSTNKII